MNFFYALLLSAFTIAMYRAVGGVETNTEIIVIEKESEFDYIIYCAPTELMIFDRETSIFLGKIFDDEPEFLEFLEFCSHYYDVDFKGDGI